MSDLLKQLQKLKPKLPETKCFVPEWDRHVTLRGFSVAEGRALRKELSKAGENPDANEANTIKLIAHSVCDGTNRPLANEDGIALIETLSELTVRRLAETYVRISTGENPEGNSEPRADGVNSSSDLPSPSAGQLVN